MLCDAHTAVSDVSLCHTHCYCRIAALLLTQNAMFLFCLAPCSSLSARLLLPDRPSLTPSARWTTTLQWRKESMNSTPCRKTPPTSSPPRPKTNSSACLARCVSHLCHRRARRAVSSDLILHTRPTHSTLTQLPQLSILNPTPCLYTLCTVR